MSGICRKQCRESSPDGRVRTFSRPGKPVARLVPVDPDERTPGRLRGCITVSEDFDAPLPAGLGEAFGGDPE